MKLMTTLGGGGMITTDDAELAKLLHGVNVVMNDADTWGQL